MAQAVFKGMGGHQKGYRGANDEWLTPPEIVKALGPFDLDPCAPVRRPWDTAKQHYTIDDDGLKKEWSGRVWLNPPYGPDAEHWLKKLADHGDGIALIFSRTDTRWFHAQVFKRCSSLFFIEGRIAFFRVSPAGEKKLLDVPLAVESKNSSGAPSVLISYDKKRGGQNILALQNFSLLPGVCR